jgi:uncharacterized membrane protein
LIQKISRVIIYQSKEYMKQNVSFFNNNYGIIIIINTCSTKYLELLKAGQKISANTVEYIYRESYYSRLC